MPGLRRGRRVLRPGRGHPRPAPAAASGRHGASGGRGGPRPLLDLGLDAYVADPEERAWLEPRLGALLGVGAIGTFAREDLFSAWATFLRRVGADEDIVVLVFDDAQHADEGLLGFLEYLLGAGGFPCLFVLLARPGLLAANPGLATNRRARCCTSTRSATTTWPRSSTGSSPACPTACATRWCSAPRASRCTPSRRCAR